MELAGNGLIMVSCMLSFIWLFSNKKKAISVNNNSFDTRYFISYISSIVITLLVVNDGEVQIIGASLFILWYLIYVIIIAITNKYIRDDQSSSASTLIKVDNKSYHSFSLQNINDKLLQHQQNDDDNDDEQELAKEEEQELANLE